MVGALTPRPRFPGLFIDPRGGVEQRRWSPTHVPIGEPFGEIGPTFATPHFVRPMGLPAPGVGHPDSPDDLPPAGIRWEFLPDGFNNGLGVDAPIADHAAPSICSSPSVIDVGSGQL
jgi:hypothetical protein